MPILTRTGNRAQQRCHLVDYISMISQPPDIGGFMNGSHPVALLNGGVVDIVFACFRDVVQIGAKQSAGRDLSTFEVHIASPHGLIVA